jgi:hypothetical protein
MSEEKRVRIELTAEQRDHIRKSTGVDLTAVDLSLQELEERIAPLSLSYSKIEMQYRPQ